MKNSIKTYKCHKDSSIKQGDLVYVDKDGYIHKSVDGCIVVIKVKTKNNKVK